VQGEHEEEYHDDILHPSPIPFVLVHVACLAAIWTGVTAQALAICAVLYVARMFGVTAGYHRYFSHKSYRTSRVFQFLLACLAQSTWQRGAIWWAAKHRHHHKHSDTPDDVHSPRHRGFVYSHLGWIFTAQHDGTDFDAVPDLTKYPELVWLEKHDKIPGLVLAIAAWAIGGWPGLVVGFFWSTVLTYHGTFMINSLAHVHGKQRYVTGDDSRNNWWLAIITLGEGWHNNHHAYMASTRQGFRWWEFDPTYYALRALSWARIVWDLNEPPEAIVRNEKKLGRGVIEKTARHLAASFPVDGIAAQVRDAWAHTPTFAELAERARTARAQAEAALAELHLPNLPHVPTLDDLRERADQMYASTPSIDEIVERAREIILQNVAARLLPAPEGA
jgi:stearoyl-CoA desaturase (delta-9 desaturase)